MRILGRDGLSEVMQRELNGKRIVSGSHSGTPWELLEILDEAVSQFSLYMLNAPEGPIPNRLGVRLETSFVGPGMRKLPGVKYYPCRLSMVPELLKTQLPPEAVIVQTSRVEGGMVSLGTEVNYLPTVIEYVRRTGGLVIAQINNNMPYTFGDGELYARNQIDYAIESDEVMPSIGVHSVTEQSRKIAENVVKLIPRDACLQSGIGDVPDTVLEILAQQRDGSRYSVWTELLSDGVMRLDHAGLLDPEQPIVTSFAFGSPELYRWLNHNSRVRFRRTEVVNDPAIIAAQPRMVSINTALQVDLFGQANASYIKDAWYSGFGGQPDFTVGALHSDGGLAIMALPAWHEKAKVSSIVPRLDNPVSSFQHSYIVTEYGAAQIFGVSAEMQAVGIAAIAHPADRYEIAYEFVKQMAA